MSPFTAVTLRYVSPHGMSVSSKVKSAIDSAAEPLPSPTIDSTRVAPLLSAKPTVGRLMKVSAVSCDPSSSSNTLSQFDIIQTLAFQHRRAVGRSRMFPGQKENGLCVLRVDRHGILLK